MSSTVPTRPVWRPGLRRLWRSPTTVQLGVDPERAIVVGGLTAPLPQLLDLIDGTRDHGGLLAAAHTLGVPAQAVGSLLELLGRAGALRDAARAPVFADLAPDERERLAPEAACPGPAVSDELNRRRRASVLVVGAGRVGAAVARLLAAAGVGTVDVVDPSCTRPADLAPGALGDEALGAPREVAMRRLLGERSASDRNLNRPERPDLVILAPAEPLLAAMGDEWRLGDVRHLAVTVRDTAGVVGPLVAPRATACLYCLDHHRTDRDPAWPRIAAQLATATEPVPVPVALATAVAALAADQALAALADPTRVLPVHGGTLERALNDWRWRRRSWSLHPLCDCHDGL